MSSPGEANIEVVKPKDEQRSREQESELQFSQVGWLSCGFVSTGMYCRLLAFISLLGLFLRL